MEQITRRRNIEYSYDFSVDEIVLNESVPIALNPLDSGQRKRYLRQIKIDTR